MHRLSPGYVVPEPDSAEVPSSAPSCPAVLPAVCPCPNNGLVLFSRLSAASILSPLEGAKRAWTGGVQDRAKLKGRLVLQEPIISTDLPSKYFLVIKARGVSEPRILRTQSGYKKNKFPSETEAGVYITALGFGHLAGV